MTAFLNKLLSLLPLNGVKTAVGCVVIVVSYLVAMVTDLIPVLPQYPVLDQALDVLTIVLKYASQIAAYVGFTYAGVGALHKGVKWADK